jgi:hypothetical protein
MIAHIRYVSMNQSEVLSDDSKVIRVYISLPTYLLACTIFSLWIPSTIPTLFNTYRRHEDK